MIEVKVPDIGDFTDVPVIEILVAAGDEVAPEDALITLESDKATMDVPSPAAGVVKELSVEVGDKVSAGSLILVLDAAAADGDAPADTDEPPAKVEEPAKAETARSVTSWARLALLSSAVAITPSAIFVYMTCSPAGTSRSFV